MDIIREVEQEFLKNSYPNVHIGDRVRVHLLIKEGDRQRIQVYEGTVIARKGRGLSETITVRRISFGIGVERVLPVHSPRIEKIEVVRKGQVRRAKLYYLRDRVGKQTKVKEKLTARIISDNEPSTENQ